MGEGDFGKYIKTLRRGLKLGQEQLADRVPGLEQHYISQVERGHIQRPGDDKLEQLAEALEVTVVDLKIALGDMVVTGEDLDRYERTVKATASLTSESPTAESTQLPLTDWQQRLQDMATDLRFVKTRLEASDTTVRVVGRVPADSLRWTSIGDEYDVDVPRSWVANARDPFGVEVTGDCFRAIGLLSGDIAVCDRADGRTPRDRQIVIVRVGDAVTLKRWCVTAEGVELRDGDETVVYTLAPSDDVEVLGLFLMPLPVVER